MKIYAVEKGSYSDRRVVACTLDENKAKRIAKSWSTQYDEARVLEFEDGEHLNFPFWEICVEKGRINEQYTDNCSDYYSEDSSDFYDNNTAFFVIQAESVEIAKKIAIDKYFQWKAEKENLV